MHPLAFLWYAIYLVQVIFSYGTAYRYTKNGSDNGVALWGWMLLCSLASAIPGLGLYLWYKSREDSYNNRNVPKSNTTYGENTYVFEKREETKKCPLCGEEIIKRQGFCQFCGGNVAAKEEEARKQVQEELEQNGLGASHFDEKTINEAKMYNKFYGKAACISYLQGRLKELGLEETEIKEEWLDNLLANN